MHLLPPQSLLVLRDHAQSLLDDVLRHLGSRRGPEGEELVAHLERADAAFGGGVGHGRLGRFGQGEGLCDEAE